MAVNCKAVPSNLPSKQLKDIKIKYYNVETVTSMIQKYAISHEKVEGLDFFLFSRIV